MQLPDEVADTPVFFHKPVPPRISPFREVRWRWRDILIGLAPFLIIPVVLFPMRSLFYSLPTWSFLVASYTIGAWMFVYPLLVMRRIPTVPGLRIVIVQLLLAIPLVLIAMVAVGMVSLALHRLLGDAVLGNSPFAFDAMAVSSSRIQSTALFVLGVVVAPLAEEPFHRGMIYNALRQRMPWILAAVLESIVFALLHPYGLADRAGVFVLGLFLAGFYEWRKTLVAPMAFHALVNIYAVTVTLSMAASYANSPMIGLGVESQDDGCRVTHVLPGGPAEEAGIRVGDVIPEMDVYSVRNYRHIFSILQGSWWVSGWWRFRAA